MAPIGKMQGDHPRSGTSNHEVAPSLTDVAPDVELTVLGEVRYLGGSFVGTRDDARLTDEPAGFATPVVLDATHDGPPANQVGKRVGDLHHPSVIDAGPERRAWRQLGRGRLPW